MRLCGNGRGPKMTSDDRQPSDYDPDDMFRDGDGRDEVVTDVRCTVCDAPLIYVNEEWVCPHCSSIGFEEDS